MEEKEKVEIEKKKIRLMESKNRLQELERLMCRIYEDMILEKIPSNRYEILNSQYETEQIALSKEIKDLEFAILRYEKETDKAKKFISLISRYENFDELTTTMINEFVEKIIVHERNRKGSQTSKQKIEIYFNFIGNYEPPKEELTEEEERLKIEEEERKIKERKDRLHQNYLKRKVNGKQQEYEERYKARREQRKQEKLKVLKRAGIQVNKLEKKRLKLVNLFFSTGIKYINYVICNCMDNSNGNRITKLFVTLSITYRNDIVFGEALKSCSFTRC